MHQFTLQFASDHPALAGHFPENPVVPAVVLLDHIAAELKAQSDLEISGWRAVKFLLPLVPPAQLQVDVQPHPRGLAVIARLDDNVCLNGVASVKA